MSQLRDVDYLGALLSISWPTLFVFALQEGGQAYSWNSGVIIGTLVAGAVCLVTFAAYEEYLQRVTTKKEAILPTRLLSDLVLLLILL